MQNERHLFRKKIAILYVFIGLYFFCVFGHTPPTLDMFALYSGFCGNLAFVGAPILKIKLSGSAFFKQLYNSSKKKNLNP